MAGAGDDRPEAGDDAATEALPGARSPLLDELRGGTAPPTLVAVAIAWSATLLPSAFGRGASVGAALLALAALAAGLGGPVLARQNARAGRHLGISLFVALSTATWLAGGQPIAPLRLDPVRGAFGAIAWGVFALSWSDRWGPRPAAELADPDAPLLLPRASLPLAATVITTFGVAVALVFLVLAFQVRDPDRALVSQALALACGVGLVTAAGVVATARGKRRSSSGRRLTPPVIRALLLLVTVAIGGAVVTALR